MQLMIVKARMRVYNRSNGAETGRHRIFLYKHLVMRYGLVGFESVNAEFV